MLTVAPLNMLGPIRHAFFTRSGGVSEGLYASLNCGNGSRDEPKRVVRNRAIAMQRLGLPEDALITVHQVHSARVVRVEGPWEDGARPEADAMVTDRSGLALGILTADCAPVLLADPRAGVIGAAHAGWRGALAGVLEATVTAMRELGARPSDITAAVGPCIHQRSYEVGPDLLEALTSENQGAGDFFLPSRNPGRQMFDLAGYAVSRLDRVGVGMVTRTPCDTYAEADRFFSFRRATHLGETDYGRGLSVILLEK